MAKFVGNEGGVHIHLEGKRSHFKYGSDKDSRYEFGADDKKQLEGALTAFLKHKGKAPWKDDPKGWDACQKWFVKELGVKRAL